MGDKIPHLSSVQAEQEVVIFLLYVKKKIHFLGGKRVSENDGSYVFYLLVSLYL